MERCHVEWKKTAMRADGVTQQFERGYKSMQLSGRRFQLEHWKCHRHWLVGA